MAKKTRTELSTSAINTNLPDNTQELITPTTERAQLTDERESVVNYKDDLGGTGNAGKFLTVATDGESLTMVDGATGDVTGTGVAGQVTIWDGTNSITSKAMLVLDDTGKTLKIIIPSENASGGISIDQQGTTGTGSLQFLDDGVYKAQIVYDVSDGNLTLNSNGDIEITPTGDTVFSGGTPSVERLRISSGGAATFAGIVGINGSTTANVPLTATTSSGYEDVAYFKSAGTNIKARINLIPTGTGDGVVNATANDLVLQTGGADRLTISTGGLATFSNGIQFGTGATLDAYEEGTWTPTIGGNGTFGTYSGTTFASYVRIGNQVMLNCYFNAFSLTSSTGDFVVRNLPYAPTGGAGIAVGSVMLHSIPNSGNWVTTNLAQGSATQLEFFQTFASGGWLGLPVVTGGTRYLAFSVSYTVQ